MKKRLLPFLLLLCLLLSAASCGGERYDSLYYIDHEDGLTFGLRGSGTRPKQVVVKRGEELLWSERVKVSKEVGSLGGTYGFDCPDLNFDGHPDIVLASGIAGDQVSNLCWIYDVEKETYTLSEELSALYNVRANAELEAVFSFLHTYKAEEAYLDAPASHQWTDAATKHIWVDGALTPDIRVSITYYSEPDRYCYSVAYYNADSEDFDQPDDTWLTPEEYKALDMSFLYYFK